MATLEVYPAAGEGFTLKTNSNLNTARTGDSDTADDTSSTFSIDYLFSSPNYSVYRAHLPFDTSALAGGTVTAVTLRVEPSNVVSAQSIALVESTMGDPTNIATTDHDNYNSTELATANASWTNDTQYTYTLNASGLAAINTSGYTKLCMIDSNDLVAGAVTGCNLVFYSVEDGTESNRPLLTITYTPASGAFLNLI